MKITKEQWPDWKRRLDEIAERSHEQPEVAISLVGGTGAGKSTLLNALIELAAMAFGIEHLRAVLQEPRQLVPFAVGVGVRVLPVSNMRACTAATCEVSYADGPYRARVEFIARESWEREVQLLLADLQSTRVSLHDDEASDPSIQMSRAVRDKLWTVYRPSDDGDAEQFDPFQLVEPAEIAAALDARTAEIQNDNVDDFRKQVARYLDSQHRFWPIVRSVAIRGPFAPLRDGAKVIDLPGINDPNEAREEVTKTHLKTCRFVWLIFNIKRALTKDTIHLMQSDDFLRQVVMDGRADSLTFVGTAADDVDHETGIEEFRLNDDASIMDVVTARNKGARRVVKEQLDDLSFRLAQLAHEQRETAVRLADRLKRSKIFTVSAREFLRLRGLAKTQSAGFVDVDQTEIPALVAHLRKICASYAVTAHCQALQRQLDLIRAEIEGEAQSQQAALKNRAEVSERSRKEMRAAVEAARAFLDRDLDDARERLAQDLEAGQSLLAERVKRAVERAKHDLDQTLSRWERMHHKTIQAVCRRGGAHVGTHRNDFPADLSKPILDGIAFAWSDFFGEKLRQTLERWTDRLVRHVASYREQLGKKVAEADDVSPSVVKNLDGIFETTTKIVQEVLAQTHNQTDTKILHEQRTLYEAIPDQVKANMQSAFMKAAEEKGAGMKSRMVAILGQHAHKVSQVMFDDARDALVNGVRSLNDWLIREYETMIQAVQRNASLAAENLVVSGERMTADAMAAEQAIVTNLQELLTELVQTPTE